MTKLRVSIAVSSFLVIPISSQSPELNTVCYGKSDYHVGSKSTVHYDGLLNTTVSGHLCHQWSVDPFSGKKNYAHVLDERHNYCRGVDTRSGRPWCYIDLEASEVSVQHKGVNGKALRRGWDWCAVPHCQIYRTECQGLRDRFDAAEKLFEESKEIFEGTENG